MANISFTDRELDLMAVLRDRGAATVAEVQGRLPHERLEGGR